MKRDKIIFYIGTGIMTALMLISSVAYFINYDEVSSVFVTLGYPTYLIYPLAVAKILGLVAIWSRISNTLTLFAYAGFFYDFLLALFAHVQLNDGDQGGAIVALVLWSVSFTFYRRLYA